MTRVEIVLEFIRDQILVSRNCIKKEKTLFQKISLLFCIARFLYIFFFYFWFFIFCVFWVSFSNFIFLTKIVRHLLICNLLYQKDWTFLWTDATFCNFSWFRDILSPLARFIKWIHNSFSRVFFSRSKLDIFLMV